MKKLVNIVLAVALAYSTSLMAAQPRGAGGPGPSPSPGPSSNPRATTPAPAPHVGPRHGHGLPDGARALWIAGTLYFIAAGTYYLWSAERNRYEVVSAPANVESYDVIAYPAAGQSDEQQGRDRYECHSWAVQQSGFDPARATQAPAAEVSNTYRRALSACLQGRGYSVQ
ncbi:hypothetical protein GO613_13245 [Azoarcus communis]|nr:hypothetical protein [Parazoarcus communis]